MSVRTKTLIKSLSVIIVLLASLVGVGVILKLGYNPLQAFSSTSFPSQQTARLHTLITQSLTHPGILDQAVQTIPVQQESLNWTSYKYALHAQNSSVITELAYSLSEAIEAGDGKIFQTYYQADARKATLVVGVESYITHTIVMTWEVPQVATPPPEDTREEPEQQFRAAIVIDDLGANLEAVERLLNLNADFTFSILPHLKHSATIANLLHQQGRETLLHLPMEPQNFPEKFPGRGAIMTDTPPDRIREIIQRNLQTVPFAAGVNNHMGSQLTANSAQMRRVLLALQEQQLFFLDSRTTAQTVAYNLARQMGVPTAKRKVFLDVFADLDFVRGQLYELAALAEQGEPAIAIGHPKEATLQALEELLPEFQQRHITIVRVSEFVQ